MAAFTPLKAQDKAAGFTPLHPKNPSLQAGDKRQIKFASTGKPCPQGAGVTGFTMNIAIVFIGTSLVNFINLLYQLLIAHKLSALDFAAFNSLLSIFMIISSPLGTIQTVVAKYSAEFHALGQTDKVKLLISGLLKKAFIPALLTLLIFWFSSGYIMGILKIPYIPCGYILAFLIASAWLMPVFSGGVQGLELFGWFTCGSLIAGVLKLGIAFGLIILGYNIFGALAALLASNLAGIVIFYYPLRRFIAIKSGIEDGRAVSGYEKAGIPDGINYKEVFIFLFPVAISYFCFFILVNLDMVLVKCFFSPQDSGFYSLAQMVGKIFLFLPVAASIVMFPRTSSLKAKSMDTVLTLKIAILYILGLSACASLFYNLFPGFALKILTGKVYPESVLLGRFFSVSMVLFALLYTFISYFLSIKDLRFIKYLVFFTFLQFLGIFLFHSSLMQVQAILCVNALLLFLINLALVYLIPCRKSPGLSPGMNGDLFKKGASLGLQAEGAPQG